MRQIKILHITPHLGGGVGSVLLNYFAEEKKSIMFLHNVACLDFATPKALNAAENLELDLCDKMFFKKLELKKMISQSDIVLLHWWNHPLLYDFLVRTQLPPCRLVLWSHISGFQPPCVFTQKIFQYPDMFVFTTPISLEANEVNLLSDEHKKKLRVVWATSGVDYVKSIRPRKHCGFNIGYIGTVDYAKMHPNFLSICDKIRIRGVNFIVCGGASEKAIQVEAEDMGVAEKFNFTGLVKNISRYLSIFDVFGYLLAPYHYGTCDQVLAESLAAGVVPVVLANRMEKSMVKNLITGIVAQNETEYIESIQMLHNRPALRQRLSANAKEYAVETFSVAKMSKEWGFVFNEVLALQKTYKKWSMSKKDNEISAKDIFLESLGNYGKPFYEYCLSVSNRERAAAALEIRKLGQSTLWRSPTKGTVHHYHTFFPNDKYLHFWSKIMKDQQMKNK